MDAVRPQTPRMPLILGFGGVFPFAAMAGVYWWLGPLGSVGQGPGAPAEIALMLLILWGGLILAFLGGARWGRELTTPLGPGQGRTLIWAIMPSIIAWAGVGAGLPEAGSPALGLLVLIFGFLAMLTWDLLAVRAGIWPRWYAGLRVTLTAAAVASLMAGLIGVLITTL